MIRHDYLPSPHVVQNKEALRIFQHQDKPRETGSSQLPTHPLFSPQTSTYALVIGADRYANPTLQRLDFIKNDADRIASVLSKNYSIKKLVLLTGHQAQRESILHEIRQTLTQVTKDDNIFVYFAGHGFQREKLGQELTYFGTYDTDPSQLEYTALSSRDFQEILSNKIAGRVLLILDACHPESEFKQFKNIEFSEYAKLFTVQSNRAIITSRVFQEVEPYSYKRYQRFFTKYLLEGLGEGVSKKTNIVRVRDLYYYISEKLSEQDFDFKPILYSSSGENFPLLVKKTDEKE
jgi:uncharacterized caspase-like protein